MADKIARGYPPLSLSLWQPKKKKKRENSQTRITKKRRSCCPSVIWLRAAVRDEQTTGRGSGKGITKKDRIEERCLTCWRLKRARARASPCAYTGIDWFPTRFYGPGFTCQRYIHTATYRPGSMPCHATMGILLFTWPSKVTNFFSLCYCPAYLTFCVCITPQVILPGAPILYQSNVYCIYYLYFFCCCPPSFFDCCLKNRRNTL
jgi:hypothetical protein